MTPASPIDASVWASCGAMHLTGDPSRPALAIDWRAGERLEGLTARFGLDTSVLTERAAILQLRRGGRVSCGGRTRLLRARDEWIAFSLARDEDLQLLPALVGVEAAGIDDAWAQLGSEVQGHTALELEERGALLGASVSVVGIGAGPMVTMGGPRRGSGPCRAPLVVDMSALWAGPLCTDLLRRSGAEVIKVEDPARPDGARTGLVGFYDLLNQSKASVALDFRSRSGRSRLVDLLCAADVVVTSARARAFEQLGISVEEILSSKSDKVWTAITAFGWTSNRVGYGDDVAAGVGLVAWDPSDGQPRFAADAIADPLCGLEAAARTLDCLGMGGRWFVDASLAGAAAATEPQRTAARPATALGGGWFIEGQPVREPNARTPLTPASPLGADTERVLAALAA